MITIGFPIGMTIAQIIYTLWRRTNVEFGAGFISATWITYLGSVYLQSPCTHENSITKSPNSAPKARSLLYCSSFFELRRSTTHFPQYQISSIRLPVIAISSRIPQQWQGIQSFMTSPMMQLSVVPLRSSAAALHRSKPAQSHPRPA